MVVAPPFLYLPYLKDKLRSDFAVSAQDVWVKGDGAFTGEIRCGCDLSGCHVKHHPVYHSANMLADFNIPYTITGHSERRTLCGETSQAC